AWLIVRFIDSKAQFKFVAAEGYRPRPGELRFDMFEAEYTHEGDACTFETLVARFGLGDRALRVIAEIVHDIDCKEAKFGRPEASGIERLIAGIAKQHAEDAARLAPDTCNRTWWSSAAGSARRSTRRASPLRSSPQARSRHSSRSTSAGCVARCSARRWSGSRSWRPRFSWCSFYPSCTSASADCR